MHTRFATRTEDYLAEILAARGYRRWGDAALELRLCPKTLIRWRSAPVWSAVVARQVSGLLGRPTPPELVVSRRFPAATSR